MTIRSASAKSWLIVASAVTAITAPLAATQVSAAGTRFAASPLAGKTVAVDPGHNGGNASHA